MANSFRDLLDSVLVGSDLDRCNAEAVMHYMMEGELTDAQMGGMLAALRAKGETVEEITGFVQEMRAHLIPVTCSRAPLIDTCGTGGSKHKVFNVSTTAAFIAAAGGASIAKHGNRAISGVCGSADVLEALGVDISIGPGAIARCIDTLGIGFMFAQAHHPALKHVSKTRRELAVRTVFNLLGPLCNPAGAQLQVLGVYEAGLEIKVAHVLSNLHCKQALVVHGEPGMGEISTVGLTRVTELRDGSITSRTESRATLGLSGGAPTLAEMAPANTAAENANYVRRILAGKSDCGARRELAAVNAAAALYLAGKCETLADGVDLAQSIISSGDGLNLLNSLATLTSGMESN
jgi:anthranilate phosphoribosyltransferase